MSSRGFQPPSTPAEVNDQLRNLHEGLKRLSVTPQLPKAATLAETQAQVNTILALLAQITQGADVRRR